mmetsp:Transcript_108536/g.291453  ORF Transcript_108536/g.291453 Transcript_108536/m.291453 type:complete len:281 (+) Transcript_108536:242-1084(+)
MISPHKPPPTSSPPRIPACLTIPLASPSAGLDGAPAAPACGGPGPTAATAAAATAALRQVARQRVLGDRQAEPLVRVESQPVLWATVAPGDGHAADQRAGAAGAPAEVGGRRALVHPEHSVDEVPSLAAEHDHVARLQAHGALCARRRGGHRCPVAELRGIAQVGHDYGPVLLREVVVVGVPAHAAPPSVVVHGTHLRLEGCHWRSQIPREVPGGEPREVLAELPEAFGEDAVDPVPKPRLGPVVQRPSSVIVLAVPASAHPLVPGPRRHRHSHVEQGLL